MPVSSGMMLPLGENIPADEYHSLVEMSGYTPPNYLNSTLGLTSTGKIFLYGGFDKYEDEMDSNVRILDLNTGVWTKRASHKGSQLRDGSSGAPAARSGHTAVMRGDTAIIFGGEVEDRGLTNECLLYNVETDKWSIPEVEADNELPVGRSRHAACLSPDGSRMVVSGGLADEKEVMSDIYWFEFETDTWVGPFKFVPRYDHTIKMYNNKLWAFGGLTPDMDRVSEVAWFDFDTRAVGKVQITSLDFPLAGSSVVHFYTSGSPGTMLDVTVPGSFPNVMTSIAYFDIDTLNWRSIVEDFSAYNSKYAWYHTIVQGSKLILLGEPNQLVGYDEKLTHMLTIDLAEFGYMDGEVETPKGASLAAGTMSHDMYEFYKRSEMCDFEITSVMSDRRPPLDMSETSYMLAPPIKVHMMVLAARWPHFQRVIASGMSEAQTRTLFIPEPYRWVNNLIEYMYRDTIEGYDVEAVTGLLILANLYELPRLRKLCIEVIIREGLSDVDMAVMVWEKGLIAQEHVIQRNAALYCCRHWGKVVRCDGFKALSKENLLRLCEEADERSLITTTRNSPHANEFPGVEHNGRMSTDNMSSDYEDMGGVD